jgi:hypothetical protein
VRVSAGGEEVSVRVTWRLLLWAAVVTIGAVIIAPIATDVALEFARREGWWTAGSVGMLESLVHRLRDLHNRPAFWLTAAFIFGVFVGSLVDQALSRFDGSRAKVDSGRRAEIVNLGHRVVWMAREMGTEGIEDDNAVVIAHAVTLLDVCRNMASNGRRGRSIRGRHKGHEGYRNFLPIWDRLCRLEI